MRIFILTVLLMVITSFTTVTLAAIPSSQGLVTETLKKYSYLDTSVVINTEQLKIEPRRVQELSNIGTNYEHILHIDPGNQELGSNYNTLAHITEPILHIDPGRD